MEYSNDWISLNNLGFSDYECHKSGVIRRCGYKKHIGYKDKKGRYLLVDMTRNKVKMPAMRIDRIILIIFKGNPIDINPNVNSEVIHLNYNTLDSDINNLRWVSGANLGHARHVLGYKRRIISIRACSVYSCKRRIKRLDIIK
ncbi:Hypothetical protein HVR_LOCUS1295 [uncultured virus]|nr:Hypothetical protein HVR_LOCUS1295 [uncultured virus]